MTYTALTVEPIPDSAAGLRPDPQLRELLLGYYLDTFTGQELTQWLRQLGQDGRGTIAEKQQRIRAHTQYLAMPAETFPAQTEGYLSGYRSESLADLCQLLQLPATGTRESRYRRIMREIHTREGWLPPIVQPLDPSSVTADIVASFLRRVPLPSGCIYERDYYPIVDEELSESFGPIVYQQSPIALGSTLRVDFHVGEPSGVGVGIEVKMPTDNADIQRAIGQLGQYQQRYGANLVLFVVTDLLKPEARAAFAAELARANVLVVMRDR